jgi:hypothetical protein
MPEVFVLHLTLAHLRQMVMFFHTTPQEKRAFAVAMEYAQQERFSARDVSVAGQNENGAALGSNTNAVMKNVVPAHIGLLLDPLHCARHHHQARHPRLSAHALS